jgi:hypothetical protein
LVFSSARNRETLTEIAASLSDAMMAMVTSEEIRSEGECDSVVKSEENEDPAHTPPFTVVALLTRQIC